MRWASTTRAELAPALLPVLALWHLSEGGEVLGRAGGERVDEQVESIVDASVDRRETIQLRLVCMHVPLARLLTCRRDGKRGVDALESRGGVVQRALSRESLRQPLVAMPEAGSHLLELPLRARMSGDQFGSFAR